MTRKCTIDGCTSKSGSLQHRGVTFHAFPFDSKTREIWITNCRLSPEKNITKNVLVCSRHFCRVDFQTVKTNKYSLKQGAIPTIFPWNKAETASSAESNSSLSEQCESSIAMEVNEKLPEEEEVSEAPVKRSCENDSVDEHVNKAPKLDLEYENPSLTKIFATTSDDSKTEKSIKISSQEIVSNQRKIETISPGFSIGIKVEAQDFNGVWHTAKVVEVDSDEREVLIRFEKSRKSKSGGGIEEWIPMNSSRLRQIASQSIKKPPSLFEIGEKCMARWSGPRKFPATVTKVLGNDSYEVLFDDGYMKVVKGHHMSKLKQKPEKKEESPAKTKSAAKKDWPLISMSSLDLKELNLPEVPKDGEWCCHWVNDQPIGEEGYLVVGDHKKPTVIVKDWRLPPNWVKHMYQRSNVLGKWDVILVNPQGKRFRSKADLKQYIEELGQVYNPDVYDFSIHRRRAKDIGAYVYTKGYKPPPPPLSSSQQFFAAAATASQNINSFTIPTISSPTITSPSVPESTPPTSKEKTEKISTVSSIKTEKENSPEDGYVYVGSLKVQIIDNLFRCPEENCNKNFRKENHLQIHVKHYHHELAKLLGVCPNMQELACKRTIGSNSDEPLPKNHLPNVQFFAKLHQQDLAHKVHRKQSSTPTSMLSSTVTSSPSAADVIQSPSVTLTTDIDKIDKEEVLNVSTPVSETMQISIAESVTTPPVTKNKPTLNSPPSSIEHIEHTTGDNTSVRMVQTETKSTSSKSKKMISRASTAHKIYNRKSSRQKLTKKYVASNLSSGFLDTSIGVSDQEETRHSFSGSGGTSVEAIHRLSKKLKLEPLSVISEANLDATSQTTGSAQENSQSPKYINENGEIIKIVRMRQEEIINCLCSYGEEDGLMIQCELCLCWQHGICNGIEKESQVPEKYICYICRNPQRGRTSLKYIHDQDWMYEGKLPVANYHAPSPDLEERFEVLRKTHILTGNLLELKKFMHSLKVKINIAENKDHPKMYLWSHKWETSSKEPFKSESESLISDNNNDKNLENEDNNDKEKLSLNKNNNGKEEIKNKKQDDIGNGPDEVESKNVSTNSATEQIKTLNQPTIPQPEAPIDPIECQRRLLEHIKNQQSCVMDRLQAIESQIVELESLDNSGISSDPTDYSKTKEMIAMYIKDLEIMKNIAKINTVQPSFVAY